VAAWKVNYGRVLVDMMGLTSFSWPPPQILISTGVSLRRMYVYGVCVCWVGGLFCDSDSVVAFVFLLI
jgi:hypothetical protein